MPWKPNKLSGSQDLREQREELSRKTTGREHAKERGHSRWGAQGGRRDKDKGFITIPACWGGAGTFPVADVGAHMGGWVRDQG